MDDVMALVRHDRPGPAGRRSRCERGTQTLTVQRHRSPAWSPRVTAGSRATRPAESPAGAGRDAASHPAGAVREHRAGRPIRETA